MDNLDLSAKLLLAKPMIFENIKLKPLTINEILDDNVSFAKYNKYLGIICINEDSIKEMLELADNENIDSFDYLIMCCMHNEESKKIIEDALSLFSREEICFYFEEQFQIAYFASNTGVTITKNNFNGLINILREQNCIKSENKIKPQNEKQKDFLDQLKEMRNKYAKWQNKNNQDLTDIISAVCNKHSSINYLNVGELTVYQLIDSYKRLNKIDEFYLNYKSIFAGADPKGIKIKHWSGKLD